MAKAIVTLADSALKDIREIQLWYESQGVPAVGMKVVDQIFSDIQVLEQHPDIGRVIRDSGVSTVREIIRPPFRIIYQREPRRARIVRVCRGERLLILPLVVHEEGAWASYGAQPLPELALQSQHTRIGF